jgi:hypothetical protein
MKIDMTDNELIAEFMGARVRRVVGPLTGEWYYEVKLTPNANWQNVHYDTSWDWLMPVWNKFRKINLGNDYAQGVFNNYLAKIAHKIAWEEIKDAHYILVLGIKWYNNSHKQ